MSDLLDSLNSVYREVSLLEGVEHNTLELFKKSISEVKGLEESAKFNEAQLSKLLYDGEDDAGFM